MIRPRIAVLLAAYNGMKWIEAQVRSIQDQVGVDVTIFVSVDPSSDGTEAWVKALSENSTNVVLLPSVGRFGGAGKNFYRLIRDVDFCDFDYVAFSDQDDIWLSDKLKRATHFLQNGACDAYSGSVTAFWPSGKSCLLDKSQPQVAWDYLFEAAGPGCTYVFRLHLAHQIKNALIANWELIQSITLHDWFCYGFARANGYKWFIDSQSCVLYRQHLQNQVGANVGLKPLISRYRTIKSGWWFSQVLLIIQVLNKSNEIFVRKWIKMGWRELFYLGCQAAQCRRRRRDKILFSVICWVSAFARAKDGHLTMTPPDAEERS
ncbi:MULTISPECIES: glycosyltransferase [unclassified Pseudomonas]|uniref:glycosyltransferase n=1 Tax=unclassified Pseudomonas TaxID=196821 RepID=UPI0021157FD6|nr:MULTISPECIES: glycosyltransferase [unclassified Pseudomonas]